MLSCSHGLIIQPVCDLAVCHENNDEFHDVFYSNDNSFVWLNLMKTLPCVLRFASPHNVLSSSSMVIRDLTLRSAASFGSFHLIRLLYDEYMFYLVEHRVAQATGDTPIAVMSNFANLSRESSGMDAQGKNGFHIKFLGRLTSSI